MVKFFLTLLLSSLIGSYFVIGCYPSINSNGITYPRGDIDLRAGSDLIINCTLNDDYFGPSNSSDIGWKYDDTLIPSSYIRVLDRRTAQLHIANVNISDTGKYRCILRSSRTSLCLNVVTVGTPPPKINDSNFRCISEEWRNLTCRWDVPENPIRTTWALYYRIPQGNVSCPLYSSSDGAYECVFNESTQPPYRAAAPYYYFVLTGNNSYGTSVSQFRVDHFQNVVPSPPQEFSVMPYGNTGLRVTWILESMFKIFPVPLVYRLKYRSQWDDLDAWKSVEVKNRTLYILENLIPYTNYTLILQCRSSRAPDIKMMWSRLIERTHSTLPEIPNSPLQTALGGFDDVNIDMDRRNITIYWKAMSKMEQNGPDFKYVIQVYENSIFNGNIVPNIETLLYAKFYALFKNRSYTFKIKASNSIGVSNFEGTVFVERSANRPAPLEGFSVLYYYKGIYGLSWNRPTGDAQILNYTAFWCKSQRQMLDPCSASLNWQFVDGNATVVNITVSDNVSNYRFALSANGRTASSGMVWAKCMALYNGVLGKVKMLPLQVIDSNRIELNWVVDCLDRTGRIKGFNISYCVYDNSTRSCKDPPKYVFVSDCTLTSYVLENLAPYTMYSITIAPTAKSGPGEPSDALQATTFEDANRGGMAQNSTAPDDSPHNIHVTSVTNHSITLSWEPPFTRNGIITYYVISYGTERRTVNVTHENSSYVTFVTTLKKNIYSYTNYSIQMMGCTSKGCSKLSDPIVVLTDIGVPGQPEAPTVRLLNTTNAIVSWDVPIITGGPINHWSVMMISSDDGAEENTTFPVFGTSYIQHVSCEDMDGGEYRFAVRAVNIVNGTQLEGNYSSFSVLNVCFTETLPFIFNASVMSILMGATILLTLVSLCAFYVVKLGRRKFRQVKTITVILPNGLNEGSLGTYNGFKENLSVIKECEISPSAASMIGGLYGRLPSISSDEGRSSQDSGETLNITSSLTSINDELLYTDKAGHFRYSRNLSGDSSGCSSIVGSVSSSVTARTHLSSDSGTEVDFHLPRSPDMVFIDSATAWPLTPVAKTANCQLRLRSNNNPQRFGEEFDEGDVETNGDTTTLPDNKSTVLQDTSASNVHYCKVATKLVADAPPLPPPVFDSNSSVQNATPQHLEIQVCGTPSSEISSYSRVDVLPQSKLGAGYVCIGLSDTKRDVSSDSMIIENNSDTTPKSKKNRKVSLPIGIVTKINSSKVEMDDSKEARVGPYVAVALVDNTPKKVSIGYSKLASSGLVPQTHLEQSKSSEFGVSRVDEKYGKTNKNVNSETVSTPIGKGYITVASLDEHSDLPSSSLRQKGEEGGKPANLTNTLSELSNLESTTEGSWEKELENSEENVTEEDILSLTPSNSVNSKGYVSLDGVTDSSFVIINNGDNVSVASVCCERDDEVESSIVTYV